MRDLALPAHTVRLDSVTRALCALPSPPTSFIGREGTIALLTERLAEDRLLTIVGPGGCGKTRLALEVARRAVASFEDGVFFVDLSGTFDARLVAGVVAQALGLPQPPGGPRQGS